MNKEINYKGTDIEEIYKLALIGADFIAKKSEEGITVVNSLNKHLYIKTVLLARFLNVIDLPEDRVMSLEQYKTNNYGVDDFKGRGINRLKTDFDLFLDILSDEINNVIACKNDMLNRLSETIAVDMTPENVENLKKRHDELISELAKINN